jgi:hypothetical protein
MIQTSVARSYFSMIYSTSFPNIAVNAREINRNETRLHVYDKQGVFFGKSRRGENIYDGLREIKNSLNAVYRCLLTAKRNAKVFSRIFLCFHLKITLVI